MQSNPVQTKVRALYVSDLHIGSKYSNCDKFLSFIARYDYDEIYLLGDMIDGYELRRKFRWTQCYNEFIQHLLRLSKNKPIYYITGNHDDFLRSYEGIEYGNNIKFFRSLKIARPNSNIFLMHGDQIEQHLPKIRSLYYVGSFLYSYLLWLDSILLWLGLSRKIAKSAKANIKAIFNYINKFELKAVDYAKQNDCNTIIMGHIHAPCVKTISGITYINCGDWVENNTGLVEYHDGQMALVNVR